MKILKVIIIYFFVVSERIFLIPFSGIRPCTIQGVLMNEFEAKRLIKRNCIGWLIVLAYLFPFWVAIAITVFGIIVIINKLKNKKS